MYQVLTRNTNETCSGRWYRAYPTLENQAVCEYFTFELLPEDTSEEVHVIDNLMNHDERIRIRTSFRLPFAPDTYIAAFGNMYKVVRLDTERKMMRGVLVPRVEHTLSLIKCANPLNL